MRYTDSKQFREYGIILARIDDRLVHGQVVAGWNRILGAEYIVVVSDEVAFDEFRKALIENAAAPGDITVEVLTREETSAKLKKGTYKEGGVLLLFGAPSDVTRFVDIGAELDSINVGGMHKAEGKVEYATALWLDNNDIGELYKIRDLGIGLFYQMVPMENARDIFSVIEGDNGQG